MIQITDTIALNESEIHLEFIRASGPGGQNVNKVNTRVELRFSLVDSKVFSEEQKIILSKKLKNRMNSEGELILASESERSQLRNRTKAIVLFFELIEKALTPAKKRIKTSPTAASRIKRIESKKLQSDKKSMRKSPRL